MLRCGYTEFSLYENSSGERIKLGAGDAIPAGFAHVNTSKAAYIDPDGNVVHLRTDDPRVISGECVAQSRGRRIKDSVKAYFSERYKDTVSIILESGEKMRIKKDELHLLDQSYKLNHGAGVKRKNTENYRKAALERKSRTCEHCGKCVKINAFYKWHGDNCKANPNSPALSGINVSRISEEVI